MSPPPEPRQIDSWQLAELNAVAWMRHWGFADAATTKGGADGGVDVRARGALAQVKFEARQVGAPAVQRLVGARGHGEQQLVFFSGAGYAGPAVAYADMMSVALIKYDLLGRPTAVNAAAQRLLASPAALAGPGGGRSTQPKLTPDEREFFLALARKYGAVVLGIGFLLTGAVDIAKHVLGTADETTGPIADNILMFLAGLALTIGYIFYRRRRRGSDSTRR